LEIIAAVGKPSLKGVTMVWIDHTSKEPTTWRGIPPASLEGLSQDGFSLDDLLGSEGAVVSGLPRSG
jgi:hypothetical protein